MNVRTGGVPRHVQSRRRRNALLGTGLAAAMLVGLACWLMYYSSAVLSYAEVDSDLRLVRQRDNPRQVALYYRPLTRGAVGVRRANHSRRNEQFDRVVPVAIGKHRSFMLPMDNLQPGERIEVTYLNGWSLVRQQLRVPRMPPPPSSRTSRPASIEPIESFTATPVDGTLLSGQVIAAGDRRPIRGALVRIIGTRFSARTDEDGYFHIAGAPAGTHSVEIRATGFNTVRMERELTVGRRSVFRVGLSRDVGGTGSAAPVQSGPTRFVLTWDDGSRDLDGHLEGPSPGEEGRFHVDYRHPGDSLSEQYVELEAVDQAGGGPETIRLLDPRPGVYRYFVHDFSGRNDPGSTGMARSGAEVEVFHEGQVYRFRAGDDQAGNIWDVCTIEVGADGTIVNRIDNYLGVEPEVLGLYDRRTQSNRQVWITNYGGSADSEQAVLDGLAWLARHQSADGFWSSECLADGQWSRCNKGAPCDGPGRKYEMAQTGLSLLAFQAGGHYYFNNREYSAAVRRGLDWMVSKQRSDGALVSEKDRGGHSKYHTFYMYDHGIATFALADACAAAKALGEPVNRSYVDACRRAVRYIESQQHEDGGWRYTDDFERYGDSSVSGWQVLALKSAKEAGIELDYKCIEKVRDFFDHTKMDESGRTWYERHEPVRKQQSEATTGIGMLARQFLLGELDHPLIARAAPYLADLAESNQAAGVVDERGLEYQLKWNYYTWYNCTLAMFQAGGPAWDRWNDIIRNTIIKLQRHDGCERGSWDPDTQWGERGGRIYTTALAILTLETYYRYTKGQEIDEQYETVVVSPGEIPRGVVAEPEPIEYAIREPAMIEELAADDIPIVVEPVVIERPSYDPLVVVQENPPVDPSPVVIEPAPAIDPVAVVRPAPVVVGPAPVVRPAPVPSRKVGGSKIITVGSAKYGDLEIEAEVEEEKGDTFLLTLRTSRANIAGLAALMPADFRVNLVAVDGRTIPVQEFPPQGPVGEGGQQILKGQLVYILGPRGATTIRNLHTLTVGYKANELEHAIRSH